MTKKAFGGFYNGTAARKKDVTAEDRDETVAGRQQREGVLQCDETQRGG